MTEHTEKKCSKCGQKLRFPKNIGGMIMKCPSCGKKFYSDFKIGNSSRKQSHNVAVTIFEMPTKIIERIIRFFSR